jgi:TetR/AcrR family transcriptional regulator, transcriptional repressor for nem operon
MAAKRRGAGIKGKAAAASSGQADRILDVAERLAQTMGFNGFSYADIAGELGVTKASLHYHFASKADLGSALVARYHVAFLAALAQIDGAAADPLEKLRRYTDIYVSVLSNERMCLCGMLAAEYATLPTTMQKQLSQFFDANESWLSGVLDAGRRTRRLKFEESPAERAQLLLGVLEGAMLVARTYSSDTRRLQSAANQVLHDLCPSGCQVRMRDPRPARPRRVAARRHGQ